MASSMWSSFENAGALVASGSGPMAGGGSGGSGGPGAAGGGGGGASVAAAGSGMIDPTALLNNQLISALSTIGDAQYWEESISPHTIKQSLMDVDNPSNPASSAQLLKGMKWLLAQISKGRDVSDFYPVVVKLVGVGSGGSASSRGSGSMLEIRKMVYMYLVQYANYDSTTRELSLLSINAFQRGLADAEPLIRALALRVLTSINLNDILQIQMLAVQKCSLDNSPYVRKCAANAVAKLYTRCDSTGHHNNDQKESLLGVLKELLDNDECTMVLTSCLISLNELCPQRLDLVHQSYRKVCHLLTDMDEWGQIIVIDLLTKYCRTYFCEPEAHRRGTAERIDSERRIIRRTKIINTGIRAQSQQLSQTQAAAAAQEATTDDEGEVTLPPYDKTAKQKTTPKKVKRRVVRKGFYSDEEDESDEEEVYRDPVTGQALPSMSSAFREGPAAALGSGANIILPQAAINYDNNEDRDVDTDHKLLLNSTMPLLKSRNSGVVLAVCSLHYHCGLATVKVRSSMGKALVRIHRDRREIQYVVLSSIRTLAIECPSAFMPFLHDFFIKSSIDPPFTKHIKLDILTSLALQPDAIRTVLGELRNYIRDPNTTFACAAIRSVGRVAEMARIVHDRRSTKDGGSSSSSRADANQIALNCLYGLLTLTQTSNKKSIIGECVVVTQWILQMLLSDSSTTSSVVVVVDDPNQVQQRAIKRMLLLLLSTLSSKQQLQKRQQQQSHGGSSMNEDELGDEDGEDDEDSTDETVIARRRLNAVCPVDMPPAASAAAMWMLGEVLSSLSLSSRQLLPMSLQGDDNRIKVQHELIRLVASVFPSLSSVEKEQAIHMATKFLVSSASSSSSTTATTTTTPAADIIPLCEHVLAMGRVDVDSNVRDRARYESGLIHCTIGLKHDTDAIDTTNVPATCRSTKLTIDDMKRMLLTTKPIAPSSIPLEEEEGNSSRTNSDNDDHSNQDNESHGFRFGTLSSIVGHRARSAYIPLPRWASENSPSSLRDPTTKAKAVSSGVAGGVEIEKGTTTAAAAAGQGFYDTEPSSSSSDSDSSSETSSSGDSSSSGDESSSSSASSTSPSEDGDLLPMQGQQQQQQPRRQVMPVVDPNTGRRAKAVRVKDVRESDDESSSSSSSSSSSCDSSSDEGGAPPAAPSSGGLLIPMAASGTGSASEGGLPQQQQQPSLMDQPLAASSVADDLRGLVMAPIAVPNDADEPKDPNFERDSSSWAQMIRPEHAGGLSLRTRYIRALTKAKQAELMGLPDKPNFVCMQFRFENRKEGTSGGSIRRLRVMQRSSSSSSSSVIGPNRVVAPPEIAALAPGEKVDCVVGIVFTGTSDRDGSLQAKLDVKFGGGGIPIEVKPNLGDLLMMPGNSTSKLRHSVDEFDASVRVLQGFQRVESAVAVADAKSRDVLPQKLARGVALWPVGGSNKVDWEDGGNKLRMVGTLPSSSDPVYVLVSCPENATQAKVVVCCDHALAVNSIMNQVKRALQED